MLSLLRYNLKIVLPTMIWTGLLVLILVSLMLLAQFSSAKSFKVETAGTMAEHYGVKIEGPHKDDLFLIERLPESGQRYNFPAYKPFVPDRWLDNGDTVQLGSLSFDVVHCPGHTPGHVVFVHKPSRLAFVGDVLFRGSVGRSDLPRGNHEQLLSSIRERLWPLGDDIQFVPGHGQTSTFGWERKTNPYVADLLFDD